MLDYPKSDLLPHLHPQWSELDFFTLLRQPFVYLAIGYSNSILAEFGAQAGERLWERARTPGGATQCNQSGGLSGEGRAPACRLDPLRDLPRQATAD